MPLKCTTFPSSDSTSKVPVPTCRTRSYDWLLLASLKLVFKTMRTHACLKPGPQDSGMSVSIFCVYPVEMSSAPPRDKICWMILNPSGVGEGANNSNSLILCVYFWGTVLWKKPVAREGLGLLRIFNLCSVTWVHKFSCTPACSCKCSAVVEYMRRAWMGGDVWEPLSFNHPLLGYTHLPHTQAYADSTSAFCS